MICGIYVSKSEEAPDLKSVVELSRGGSNFPDPT